MELLRAFKPQDRWLSHGEIVRRTALPRATVSRLTFTLTALGYLQHRDEAGEFEPHKLVSHRARLRSVVSSKNQQVRAIWASSRGGWGNTR
ncbi:helix-turn-helix domain-containing protein [Variovorax sp. J2P1-59]|uniref:helix-turn-helix domain-containing protein n=1 Tax=Variovorax flavidus TaxID=3053501 RepID=UPI002576C9AD|nr:helix-turn-helix domain-containing protein [Variovorax sp. J2P1-59]MDM0078573.1 helix-turn-helix domain-containing protein [Variovorax sp. J2P1-59]